LAFFHRLDIKLRLSNYFDTCFFDSRFVCFRKKSVQSILVEGFFTKTLVEDSTWKATFTETWYSNIFFY